MTLDRRRLVRAMFALLASLALLVVLLFGTIASGLLSLNAERFVAPIEIALTRVLGRPVEITGPARLNLGWQPSLVVQDVRIDNPAGFKASPFATLSELRLDTSLLPLLRQQLIVRELRGRGVAVALARAPGGEGNWLFRPEPGPSDATSRVQFEFDWQRVVFEQAMVNYELAGAQRSVQLDLVTLDGLTGRPLQLEIQGQAHARIAFNGEADSAPLAALADKEPWPFTAVVQTPQSRIRIDGARLPPPSSSAVRMHIDVNTTDVGEINQILGFRLPFEGAAQLKGELESGRGVTSIRQIDGHIGDLGITGEVTFDNRGQRRRISGHLRSPRIDLRDESIQWRDQHAPPATLAGLYEAVRNTEVQIARLNAIDLELELAIDHLANSPGDLRELRAVVQTGPGQLLIPITANLGGASIEAELSADTREKVPRFGLRLTTSDAPFGGLADLLFDVPYVAGTVQQFDAYLSASGRTIAQLVADLEVRLNISGAQLSYGNYTGGRPVEMRVAAARLEQLRGQTMTATVLGSLRGKSFEGSINGGSVEQVLSERQTPLDLTASSGEVRLNLSGTLAEPSVNNGPEIRVALTAPRANELSPWLGFSSASHLPVAVSGQVQVRDGSVKIEGGSLVYGRSSIGGKVQSQRVDDKLQITANLAAELLAPAELRDLRDTPATARQRTLVDVPILPEVMDFGDSDLDLTVKAVQGLALDITDLAFNGRMRDGAIEPSDFSLRLQDNPLTGTLSLDTRTTLTTASMSLQGQAFDVGAMMRRLGMAQDIEAHLDHLRLEVNARGSRLGEVLEQSSFSASFQTGTLGFRDTGTQSTLKLIMQGGELRADAGEPLLGLITGHAGVEPVRLTLEGGPLRQLLAPPARWPFSISAQFADALWQVNGLVQPGPAPATEVNLDLTGKRLSDLDALLATALPPWGPYEFTGALRFGPGTYQVEEARITIGSSVLVGSGTLNTGASPARLDVALLAPMVQLDDFPAGDWSALPEPGGPTRFSTESVRQALAGGAKAIQPLLSPERLGLVNATLDVRVEELLAGQDVLGRTHIAASVLDGAATLGPIDIDGRSGRANILIGYEPLENEVVLSARALVDQLDYGLVASRFSPASDINGVFSLDLDLDSVTPELTQVLQNASGHVDLVVWPDALQWGGFDLWAANLMRSLLPFISPSESRINCVISFFDVKEGLVNSQALLIDTTNTRTPGSAEADFNTEQLRMRFVPRHKRPRLVSLAIPVELRGTFSDYRIALRPSDALGRVAQWFKTLIKVPLHWFGVGRIPEDGSDVCIEPAWRRPDTNPIQ